MSEITYYSIIKQEDIRKSMNEHKIEIRTILSEAINEEIIKEAANFHVMTYIDLNLLNAASNGVVNSWNVEDYFEDLKTELTSKGYTNKYIDLYTLEASKETIDDKFYINIKQTSEYKDGFLFFWDNGEIKDNKPISQYVEEMIDYTYASIYSKFPFLGTTKQSMEVSSEQEQDEFIELVNKYNSYKEVRL